MDAERPPQLPECAPEGPTMKPQPLAWWMPSRPSAPTRSRNFRQAARIARRLAASSVLPSSLPSSSLRRCRISITEWTQWEGTSISLGSYNTRRSSRKTITRRAPAISNSAGCQDAPPNGVEMPVIVKHPDRAEATRFFNYPLAAIEEALVNAVYHRGYDQARAGRSPRESRGDRYSPSYPGPDPSIRIEALARGRPDHRQSRSAIAGRVNIN